LKEEFTGKGWIGILRHWNGGCVETEKVWIKLLWEKVHLKGSHTRRELGWIRAFQGIVVPLRGVLRRARKEVQQRKARMRRKA